METTVAGRAGQMKVDVALSVDRAIVRDAIPWCICERPSVDRERPLFGRASARGAGWLLCEMHVAVGGGAGR